MIDTPPALGLVTLAALVAADVVVAAASQSAIMRSETSRRSLVYTGPPVCYDVYMDTVTSEVSTRELRSQLSDVLGRAMYAGERIGVTRNGKLAAVVVGVADLEALEEFEMTQDVAAYRDAIATDDGGRVSLDELRRDLAR